MSQTGLNLNAQCLRLWFSTTAALDTLTSNRVTTIIGRPAAKALNAHFCLARLEHNLEMIMEPSCITSNPGLQLCATVCGQGGTPFRINGSLKTRSRRFSLMQVLLQSGKRT